jgi:hypothetical protein
MLRDTSRFFLNYYVVLDKKLKSENNKGWISKYNFLSLLNLPEQMLNFGPLLNLWEGGYLGERYISTIKPEIVSGLRNNWQPSLYKKIMRKYFFEVMKFTQEAKSSTIHDNDITTASKKNMARTKSNRYISIAEVNCYMSQSLPLVTEYNEGIGKVVLRFQSGITYVAIATRNPLYFNECYFHYFNWVQEHLEPFSSSEDVVECLLLPYHDVFNDNDEPTTSCPYYVVTSDWREFSDSLHPVLADVSTMTHL